jgi:hypothetical protein
VQVPYFLHIAVGQVGASNDPNVPPAQPNDPNAPPAQPAPPTDPNAPAQPVDPNAASSNPLEAAAVADAKKAEEAAKAELKLDPSLIASQALLVRLNKVFPNLKAEKWDDVDIETPVKGQMVKWQRLVINGESTYRQAGIMDGFKLPGTIWVYFVENQGWQVIVLLRIPESIQKLPEMRGYDQWAERMCGTIMWQLPTP